ncbi:MAG: hypothetical protein RLZZ502_412 [Pseudomonadota bacterium]|jgi:hypothetical protein
MNDHIHLLIGTPAYGGMVHVDYVSSLLHLRAANIPFTLLTIGNESLITRARNTVISSFYARPELSHLLFLDGDVRIDPQGVERMLSRNKDVIGAPVALKGRNPDGTRIFNIGRNIGAEGPLWINQRIGTAALMFSRRAVNALVEDAQANGRAYQRNNTQRGNDTTQVHYDIFQVGVQREEYLSEDYWVCHRLRQLGFHIYVDPTVVTQHHGTIAV